MSIITGPSLLHSLRPMLLSVDGQSLDTCTSMQKSEHSEHMCG